MTMHRQDSYAYPYANSMSSSYSSHHSSSSAFSASANPNEDWTKISDLAERRRIQNRIAQRNYRKKIKRRLEDLERRAGSTSVSPEPPQNELFPPAPSRYSEDGGVKRRKSKSERPSLVQPISQGRPAASRSSAKETHHDNMFERQYTRQLTMSPPPSFAYSHTMPEQPVHAPYPQHAAAYSLPAPYADFSENSLYLPPIPVTLPSMSNHETAKTDGLFGDDDSFGSFNLSYPPMATGMDLPAQSYQGSNAYTPPLSHSHSFEFSRDRSPSEQSIIFPSTPISMPDSPHAIAKQQYEQSSWLSL